MKSLRVLVLLLGLVPHPVLSPAEEIRVNTLERGVQGSPAVAVDGNGGFVVVWQFHEDGTRELDCIRGRIFEPDGSVHQPELRIDAMPGDYARNPSIAITTDGKRFAVAWEGGSSSDKARRTIWARVFRRDGTAISEDIYVNTRKLYAFELGVHPRAFGRPGISMADDGSFVVVWRAHGGRTCSRFKVFARRFTADGKPAGQEFPVDEEGEGTQLAASVGHDGQGNFVVSWLQGWRFGMSDQQAAVWARRFDAAGKPRGPALRLSREQTGGMLPAALSVAGDGSFAVAWWYGDLCTSANAVGTVKLRLVDPEGGSRGRAIVLTSSAGAESPALATVGDRGALVAWLHGPTSTPSSTIVGQLVGLEGSTGPQFMISQPTCSSVGEPRLSAGANGVAVAVWQYSWASAISARRFPASDPEHTIPTVSPGRNLSSRLATAVRVLDDPIVRESRIEAANTLICLQQTAASALPTAVRCLHEEKEARVRARCATAVGSIAADGAAATGALRRALRNEKSLLVCMTVLQTFGLLGADALAAEPDLVDVVLHEESAWLRAAAAVSLGRIEAPSAAEILAKVLKDDPDDRVRIEAAAQLYDLVGDQGALGMLKAWAQSESPKDSNATHALLRLTQLRYPPVDTLVSTLSGWRNGGRIGYLWNNAHDRLDTENQTRAIAQLNAYVRDTLVSRDDTALSLEILRALARVEQNVGEDAVVRIMPFVFADAPAFRGAATDALLPRHSRSKTVHSLISTALVEDGGQDAVKRAIDLLYRIGIDGLLHHEAEFKSSLERVDAAAAVPVEGAMENITEERRCLQKTEPEAETTP